MAIGIKTGTKENYDDKLLGVEKVIIERGGYVYKNNSVPTFDEINEAIKALPQLVLPNGLTWSSYSTPVKFCDIIYTPVGYLGLAYDDGHIYRSNDIQNPDGWEMVFNHASGSWMPMTSIRYNGTQYLAIGHQTVLSDDGINWRVVDEDYNDFLSYYEGVWLRARYGTNYCLQYSTDGTNWVDVSVVRGGVEAFASNNNYGVIGLNGNWLYYTPDGKSWYQPSTLFNGTIKCIAYHDGLWLAGSGADRGLFRSTNGTSWTNDGYSYGYITSLIYACDKWIMATDSINKYSTDNGITWNNCVFEDGVNAYTPYMCAKDDGSVVIATDYSSNKIWYTNDGITWKTVVTNNGGAPDMGVKAIGKYFAAFGSVDSKLLLSQYRP